MMDADYSKDALLCWPVEFLPGLSYPITYHVTAAWMPKTFTPKEAILEAVRGYSGLTHGSNWYRMANVTEVSAFGPDFNVPVLRLSLDNHQVPIGDNRAGIVRLLNENGIVVDETYRYNPHVTVPLSIALRPPKSVLLRPLELWYHDDEPVVV